MKRILIIEDSSDIQALLYEELQGYYRIYQAYSGTEGLLYLDQEKLDLVLLDMMLPGLTGEQVLERIRQKSGIPVIMVTALADKATVSRLLLAGANDYVTKPFDLEELKARILVQLRQAGPNLGQAEISQHGGLVLHHATFEIEIQGNRRLLNRKEYEILQFLMAHPKQIFTKSQLYEAVWQEPYMENDYVLNTQLSHLRKKIGELDPDTTYIATVWGVGVRLAEVAS